MPSSVYGPICAAQRNRGIRPIRVNLLVEGLQPSTLRKRQNNALLSSLFSIYSLFCLVQWEETEVIVLSRV